MQRYSSAGPGLFASQQDACRNPCLRVRARMCIYIHTLRCVHRTHTGTQRAHRGAHPTGLVQMPWVPCNTLSQPLQVASWALGPWHSSPVRVLLYQCCTRQPGLPPPCPAARWVAWGQDTPQCAACLKPCAGCWCSTLPGDALCRQSWFHGKRGGIQPHPVPNLVPW